MFRLRQAIVVARKAGEDLSSHRQALWSLTGVKTMRLLRQSRRCDDGVAIHYAPSPRFIASLGSAGVSSTSSDSGL